jgi:hypothetical protein
LFQINVLWNWVNFRAKRCCTSASICSLLIFGDIQNEVTEKIGDFPVGNRTPTIHFAPSFCIQLSLLIMDENRSEKVLRYSEY